MESRNLCFLGQPRVQDSNYTQGTWALLHHYFFFICASQGHHVAKCRCQFWVLISLTFKLNLTQFTLWYLSLSVRAISTFCFIPIVIFLLPHGLYFLIHFCCFLQFSAPLHLKEIPGSPIGSFLFYTKKKIYSLDDFIQFYCFKCHLYADNFQIYISSLDFFPRLPAPVSMTTWRPNRQPEPNITETPVSRSTASHALLSWEVPDESGISLFHN